MPSREDVYAALNTEFAYQDRMTADTSRPDMVELSPGDHLLAMEHLLREARTYWYANAMPHAAAADSIRKVTALGVRFMERTSAPLRCD